MNALIEFLKKEFTLVIAGIAALVSCLFVPVTNYINYINTDTVGLLFCLMIAIAGFRESNLLAAISCRLLGKGSAYTRKTGTILIFIAFFSSMFFTNDVALIAFVPITAALFRNRPNTMIYVIVLQTVAANLGGMLTPFGNPQNLFLYGHYNMTPVEFFSVTLPVTGISALLILILCVFIKNEPLGIENRQAHITGKKSYLIMYAILFILCLLAVFGILDVIVVFASVCVVAIIMNIQLFAGVDYGLLLTFAFFFIFVGNIQNIEGVRNFITHFLDGHEMLASTAISQVISNVPAAIMLSGFTNDARALILGVDIGGLGTIVASLASIISLRIYMETEKASPLKYMGVFTLVNVVLLVIIYSFTANLVL